MTEKSLITADAIGSLIVTIRGQRVMVDSDLAAIYGVSTTRLNEQLKRNLRRFPADFAFQLTREEFTDLMSQSARSKSRRGGRTKLPWVFTEHGTIMVAMILNSPVAVEASVRVVRAFVCLRELVAVREDLARRIAGLEGRVDGQDGAIKDLFDAIQHLVGIAGEKKIGEIGFHIRECATQYRVRSKKRF